MMEPTDTPDLTSTQTASSSLHPPFATYLDDATLEDHDDHGSSSHLEKQSEEQFLSLLPPELASGSRIEYQEQQLMFLEDTVNGNEDDESSATSLVLNWSHDVEREDDDVRIAHVVDAARTKPAGGVSPGDGAVEGGASCNETPKKIMFCLLENPNTTDTSATTTTATTATASTTPDMWTESSKSRVLYRRQSSDCLKATTEEKRKSVSFIDWIMPSNSFCSPLTVLEVVCDGGKCATRNSTEPVEDEATAKARALQELTRPNKREEEEGKKSNEESDTLAENDWFWFPVDDGSNSKRRNPSTPLTTLGSSLTPTGNTSATTPQSRSSFRRTTSKRTSFVLPSDSLPSSPPLSSSSLRNFGRDFSRHGSEYTRWDSIALSQGDCAWDMDGDDSDDGFFTSEPPTGTFVTNRSVRRSAFTGVTKVPCSRVYAKPRDISWSDSGGSRPRVATQSTRRRYWW